ncbi:phosphatase PAP2 family protein [Sphingomonas sp. PB2P19]|uniref:phosphatase PAP2 family protein n=1 Tax=Sphingomonas rhamnosi TaxID=3096156 RepID=UPI002FC5E48F
MTTGKTTAKQAVKTVVDADERATHKAARHRDAPLIKAGGLLAELGDQPQMIATSVGTALVGLAMKRSDLVRGGLRMLTAHIVATAVKNAIKHSVDRARPEKAIDDGETVFAPGESRDHDLTSFPSGHTAGAVAVARAVSRDVDGAAVPAALIATGIAAAQPLNGKHYLTDLVAGAAVGWVAEALVSTVFDRVAPPIEDAAQTVGVGPTQASTSECVA